MASTTFGLTNPLWDINSQTAEKDETCPQTGLALGTSKIKHGPFTRKFCFSKKNLREWYISTTPFFFAQKRIFASMKKIGLLSDTHSFLDEKIFDYFKDCDEIWHAGDIGHFNLVEQLEAFKPLKAVYGNIDNAKIRAEFPLDLRWDCEGLNVWMTHIGGYPGRYNKRVRTLLATDPPNLFICGHSHILKIMPDKKHNLLHINPGACGVHGFHKMKTIVRFSVENAKIDNLEVIELGLRAKIS